MLWGGCGDALARTSAEGSLHSLGPAWQAIEVPVVRRARRLHIAPCARRRILHASHALHELVR